MKCMQDKRTNLIYRLTDPQARRKNLILWRYVPKWMYKDQEHKPYRGERLE